MLAEVRLDLVLDIEKLLIGWKENDVVKIFSVRQKNTKTKVKHQKRFYLKKEFI